MAKKIRLLFGALGHATRPSLAIFEANRARYRSDYGLEFTITGVCDSQGAVVNPQGMDFSEVESYKARYGTVSAAPQLGRPGWSAQEMIARCDADIYIEALPPNLPSGEPGTGNIIAALNRGMHVVTANKAPLALHWNETVGLARQKGLMLLYGTAASAGLNALQLEQFLGGCGDILYFDGIFNCSANYVIQKMQEGQSYEEAVAGAKAIGTLDPNPASDVEGWDAAMKCCIHANNIWNTGVTLSEAHVSGIETLTPEEIRKAARDGECWRLVSHAEKGEGGKVSMWTGVKRYPLESPFGRNTWDDKVIFIKSALQEDILLYGMKNGATATPGNIVLDVLTIAKELAKS